MKVLRQKSISWISIILLYSAYPVATYAQELSDINEIKAMLAKQNEILQQQQQTIEHFKEQNDKLREAITKLTNGIDLPTDTNQREKDSIELENIDFEVAAFEDESSEWRFNITPRTGLWANTHHNFVDAGTLFSTSDEALHWINGGSISVTSPWLPDTSFIFSGFTGNDSGNSNFATKSLDSPTAFTSRAKYDSDLLFLEFVARTLIEDTTANWFVRLEHTSIEIDNTVVSGVPIFGEQNLLENDISIWTLGAGSGGFFNLTDNGLHRVFSNVMLGMSVGDVETTSSGAQKISEFWWGPTVDVNVGYEWIINNYFSVSPRYRGQFVYFFTENIEASFGDQFYVIHGPELHFNFRF